MFPYCMEKSYQRLLPPQSNSTIFVNMVFDDFEDVSDADHAVTIVMKITLHWVDKRIKQHAAFVGENHPEGDIVEQNTLRYMWVPDFAIYNLKQFHFIHVIKRLAVLRIFPDSSVQYQFQTRLSVGCQFDFRDYPFDKQECLFLVGGYGATSEELIYDGDYYKTEGFQKPLSFAFKVVDLDPEERIVEAMDANGNVVALYSVAGFKMKMKRSFLGKIYINYLPAALAVFVSWISFTIDQEATAGRMSLLVLLTLWQINMAVPLSRGIPLSKHMTAIEEYSLVCLVMNAAALMEYGLIICQRSDIEYLSTTAKLALYKIGQDVYDYNLSSDEGEAVEEDAEEGDKEDERWKERKEKRRAKQEEWSKKKMESSARHSTWFKIFNMLRTPCLPHHIDNISIFLFPAVFIIYNVVYWNHHVSGHAE